MADLPDAHISHQTRDRLRVRIPLKKGDGGFFSSVREKFSGFPSVEKVEVNVLTGSVLIVHSSEIREIAGYAEKWGLFRLKTSAGRPTVLSHKVTETFKDFDRKIRGFTGNEIDVPGIAFLGLLGLGTYQIGKGNVMAIPWYAAFWYGLNIFLKAQPGRGEKGE